MTAVTPFTDDQARALVNIEQHYDVWIEAERERALLPYGMKWKRIAEREYLYEVFDRDGNGRSLGARTADTEDVFATFTAQKSALKERLEKSAQRLDESCRVYRALSLPMIPGPAAKVLRECDRRGLLGASLMVVGTNAMPAYAIEAGGRFIGVPDETDDFDLAWTAASPTDGAPFWSALKAVDRTYTVNMERTFQARNADAYEIELLVAPSRAPNLGRLDKPSPIPLEEQEWLLLGKPVAHVVTARDRSPARIVAPDPRWFALQKLWLAAQAKRNPLKRDKDRRQGMALLNAVRDFMPHYPFDTAFEAQLPTDLVSYFNDWKSTAPTAPAPRSW